MPDVPFDVVPGENPLLYQTFKKRTSFINGGVIPEIF